MQAHLKNASIFLLLLGSMFSGLKSYAQVKYDVTLELDYFVVNNVRDLDGTEDLYTNLAPISCFKRKALTQINTTPLFFWSRTSAQARAHPELYKNGTYDITPQSIFPIFNNLSLSELKNLELYMGGDLNDDEGSFGITRFFKCSECFDAIAVKIGNMNLRLPSRALNFIEMSTTQTSINALVNNGTWQTLKFGSDNYFELNYYESGNTNDGWVKYMWKVRVKPHN